MDTCRCGHKDPGSPHPCHGKGYTCKNPAEHRFYGPKVVGIAGVQMKYQVQETWACDDCWAAHKASVQTH